MTQFTPEFIAAARELAAKATPRPWIPDTDHGIKYHLYGANGDIVLEVDHKNNESGFYDRLFDEPYTITACNNYEAALDEIERLRAGNDDLLRRIQELEDSIDVEELVKTDDEIEQLRRVIIGMFPMWIAAMGYCEHGRSSDIRAMSDYYSGGGNKMTSDDIHLMFATIPNREVSHD